MRYAQPGTSEHNLAAHFEYLCLTKGAQRLAYVPVVASGYLFLDFISKNTVPHVLSSANGLIIHYVTNDQIIQDNDLVLMDAGCEYKYVAAISAFYLSNVEYRQRIRFRY